MDSTGCSCDLRGGTPEIMVLALHPQAHVEGASYLVVVVRLVLIADLHLTVR